MLKKSITRKLISFTKFTMEKQPLKVNNVKSNRILKIVAISDTHGNNYELHKLMENDQQGDIFIHAGDFTRYGREEHFEGFCQVVGKLKFKHKVVIAGNHEVMLDQNMNIDLKQKKLQKYPCRYSRPQLLKMFQHHSIHYLQNELLQIEGVRIYGSPWSKKYGRSAFQYESKFEELVWKDVPQIDILVTHCPPYEIMDKAESGKRGGSEGLRKRVFQIKPKLHLFGHIHEGKGHLVKDGIEFYNLSKQLSRIEKQF